MKIKILSVSIVFFLLINAVFVQADSNENFLNAIWNFLKNILGPITGYAIEGEYCNSNSDCAGLWCIHNFCRSSTIYCGDGYCDSGENYGSCPADCISENRPNCQVCFENWQCASRNCVNGVCCEAGKTCCYSSQNCGTGVICGAACFCEVQALKTDGSSCSASSECQSGNCNNGICCRSGETCCNSDSQCGICLTSCKICGSNYYCVEKPKKANGQTCVNEYDCQSGNCGYVKDYSASICCESGHYNCCRYNSDCDSGSTCGSGYYCVSAPLKKLDGGSCTYGSECAGGYCIHNICRSSSTYCGDGYCDSGESCSSCSSDCGTCKKSDGISCSANSDCVSDNCNNGRCCTSGKTCCYYNSDCSSGYECGSNYYCVQSTPTKKANGVGCTYSSDCQSGNCNNGICCTYGKMCCDSSSDCTSLGNYDCDYNQFYCVEKTTTKKANGFSCTYSSDCQSSNCQNYVCCAYGKACCAFNYDCSTGYVCGSSNYCIQTTTTKKSNGESCNYASDCSGGYCVHGYCRSTSTYCGDYYCDSGETSSGCPSDCLTSLPTTPKCGNGVCDSDETCSICEEDCGNCLGICQSCTEDKYCSSGACNEMPDGKRCGYAEEGMCCNGMHKYGDWISKKICCSNSDCNSGYECINNECKLKASTTTTTNLEGESCSNAGNCKGGYCVRGFCSSGPTYCGDNICDLGENYKNCPTDCPAPPIKKENGRYCEINSDCASDNCLSHVCCDYGKSCCLFDIQCAGYCDNKVNYCKSLRADGESCSGYWECESKRCENWICAKKSETPTTKVFEPIKITSIEKKEEAVCGNNNCEVNLGENCENCPADCSIEGGCCTRDSLYVSLPFYTRGVSEMKDSNEVGGIIPNHKAIFSQDVIKAGTSYKTQIRDLEYTDNKVCCNENIINGDCCIDSDCREGYVCRSNRCEEIPQCSKDEDCGLKQVCYNGKCEEANKIILFIPVNYGNEIADFDANLLDHAGTLKEIYGEVSCNPKFKILKSQYDCKMQFKDKGDVLEKVKGCAYSLGKIFNTADYVIGLGHTSLSENADGWTTNYNRFAYVDADNRYTTSHEFGHMLGLTEEYCSVDWPNSNNLESRHLCGPNAYPNPLRPEYGCDTAGECCEKGCSGTVDNENDFEKYTGTDCCKGNIYINGEGEKGKSVMSKAAGSIVGLDEPSKNHVNSILCG